MITIYDLVEREREKHGDRQGKQPLTYGGEIRNLLDRAGIGIEDDFEDGYVLPTITQTAPTKCVITLPNDYHKINVEQRCNDNGVFFHLFTVVKYNGRHVDGILEDNWFILYDLADDGQFTNLLATCLYKIDVSFREIAGR